MFKMKYIQNLEKIFLNVIKDAGFPDLKLEKKIDFEKLISTKIKLKKFFFKFSF